MWRRCEGLGRIVLGILFALVVGQAGAQPLSTAELVEKSGLSAIIEKIPEQLKLGLAQSIKQGAPVPLNKVDVIHDAYDEAYAPTRVRSMLEAKLEGQLSADELGRIAEFLDSDLGQRLTEAETAAAGADTAKHIESHARELMADLGKNAHRLALFKGLDTATGGTELGTSIAIGGILAQNYALLAQTPPAPGKPSFEEVRAEIEKHRFQITAQIAEMSLTGAAYTYREFSDQDIEAYLAFANSPAGQAYFRKIGKVFAEVMVACAGDVGSLLAEDKNQKL